MPETSMTPAELRLLADQVEASALKSYPCQPNTVLALIAELRRCWTVIAEQEAEDRAECEWRYGKKDQCLTPQRPGT